jgi:uncharacterized protein YybS (DUF2232 family)
MGARHKTILSGIALISAVCILSIAAPGFGFFCFILLPLPMMIYRIRLGRKDGGVVALASMAVVTVYSGNIGSDIYFLSGMVGLGFCLGEFTEMNFSIGRIIGFAVGLVCGVGIFTLILYSNFSGSNTVAVVSEYIDTYLTITMMLYQKMGMPEDAVMELAAAMEDIRDMLIGILPGLSAAALLLIAWLNVLLARVVFKIKNIRIISDAPLNTWKTPDGLVWGLIGCVGLMTMPGGVMKLIGINGLIVLMTVYFFQGIAIVSFYFNKKQIPVFIRVLMYAIIVIQQILVLLVIGLGFFDVWFNFRRIGADPPAQ